MYEDKLRNKEKALTYYETLLFDHPGSIFVIEARKRYRAIRGETPDDTEFIDPLDDLKRAKQLLEDAEKNKPEP